MCGRVRSSGASDKVSSRLVILTPENALMYCYTAVAQALTVCVYVMVDMLARGTI